LAERVVSILQHFHLNKSGLARISGLSTTFINNLVDSTMKNPTLESILKICKPLGISVDWFVSGKGSMLENEKMENMGDSYYQEIIKNLLFEKLMLEIELGKQEGQTHNETSDDALINVLS
jgi:transcriptional regulator with XRE-family HTH domain